MYHLNRTYCVLIALIALLSIQPLRGQYPLSVESYPAVQEGLTTYRFYVNMSDATDRMSAVYGNDQAGMYINTPDGAYNSGFNSSWSASGINPAFLATFPEMADDTYATIGLMGPASTSGIADAANPSIVEDSAQPITPYFQTDGATTLESNTLTGAAWYIQNTAGNGLPDANLQVLILQVTTAGGVSGTLNYQVFPLGVGANAVYMFESFNVEPQEDVLGCTDPTSCTFNPEATLDDGSCEYLDAIGFCGGDCTEASPDSPTVCAGDEVYGCTNLDACNYDPMANISDGSCVGTPVDFCDCEGTVPDTDNDGVCDEDEVAGCTDGMACNYSADATDEDGSCEYVSCAENAFTLTVDTMAAVQEGLTTYRIHMNTVSATDRVSAVFSNVDYPMTINVPEGAWNSPNSTTWNASGVNPALFIDFPNIVDDSYATIGLSGPAAPFGPGYQDPSLVDLDMALTNLFTTDGATGFTSDTDPGLSWFILPTAVNGLPDEDGRVLLMQITTAGSINGTLNYQVFPQGNQDAELFVTTTFDGVGTFGPANGGCMQIDACNYDDTAEFEDGSCEYAEEYYDCEGECLSDTDVDGICDELEVFGCTVPIACNYEPSATEEDGSCFFYCPGCTDAEACNFEEGALQDDGSCIYPQDLGYCDCSGNLTDALGVCGGNCYWDLDMDGVCDDVDDCVGEFDECGVCNGPGAVFECGCSPIPNGECDCEGTLIDQCGVCGGNGDTCIGCTYEVACNYDPNATILDVSQCEFGTCSGCTVDGACNYNPTLAEDDGSCSWCECLETVIVDSVYLQEVLPYGLEVVAFPAVQSGLVTYRFYVQMQDSLDHLSAVFGDIYSGGILVNAPDGVYNNPLNTSWSASGINPAFLPTFPELADDTYATIGLSGPASASGIPGAADPSLVEDATQPITPFFLTQGATTLENNTLAGAVWYILPNQSNGLAGSSLKVLVMQITTSGNVSGTLNYQVFMDGLQQTAIYRTVSFDGAGEFYESVEGIVEMEVLAGCMDSEAVNYCSEAELDDGSCFYEYFGCLDEQACNYSATATIGDEALCVYIQPGACDCDGNVLDECGVCGGDGIPEGQCDCEGNVLDAVGVCGGDCESDANGNGICDVDEVGGPEACGWGTVWNADSAACVLAVPPFLGEFGDYNTLNPCYYDLDLSGSVGAGDLINFLSTYNLATGCSWTDE